GTTPVLFLPCLYFNTLLSLCEYSFLAFTFTITFDQAQAFKKQFGKYLRANQWNDMTVKVYLR
ncbi:MAG: hypothetical protein K2O18_05620, partial [Oscillospiraceae bacterium]|nr:hypothetical protein [Oscillospiraceae bacterium]